MTTARLPVAWLVGPTRRRPTRDAVRRPGDLLRLGAGLLTLAATGWAAGSGHPGRLEVAAFRLVNDLPSILDGPLLVVMQAGALAAAPISAGVALLAGRRRLGRDLALSGLLAWYLAKVAKALADRHRPGQLLGDVLLRGAPATGLGFPSGHTAVAAALATAAGPHLPVRARRLLWVVVALVGVARMYVGAHLPLDVIGGAALGCAVGAATLLTLGAPGGRPDANTVRRALACVGLHPGALEPLPADARASAPYLAVVGDRRLFVKAVSRTQRDADALYRLWRFLTLRQAGDEPPYASVKQQVEHEAYLSLLAARAGVRTPALVTTTPSVESAVFLVQEHVEGQAADEQPSTRLDDSTLADVWRQVASLHAAAIAHRDLRLANVIVDARGRPWLVDFGFAEAGASESQLDADVAQLLASLAAVVGPHCAVRSALTALEPARLARCLSQLQPAALPAATRASLRPQPHLLAELRTCVAEATGTTLTALPPLTRVRWRTVALLLVLGVAVHGLLPQLDQAGRALTLLPTAIPGWVLAAVAWSAFSYAFASLALVAASPRRLPFGRTAAVQVAGSFANRLAPAGLGGLSLNARYLQRAGLDRVEAVSTLTVNTAAGLLVHVLTLLGATGWVARTGLGQVRLPHRWPVLVAVVLILAGAGCVMFLPRIRHQLLPALRNIAARAVEIIRAPSRATGLLTSNAGITLCYALSLDASVHAYRVHVQFARVAAVYLVALAVATASPTPGGLGAVETALTAGLTAVHIPFTQALAGVLTFRLATYWLPILPGLVTYRILRRTETL